MRNSKLFFSILLFISFASILVFAQDKAQVQLDSSAGLHPGGPIAFNVTLNEPLPKGAYFQLRISPTSADQQIALPSAEPLDATRKTFRISSTLPDGALPGKWRISVIYLFLQGTSWTSNTIKPNDLSFEVEGKPYPVPTTAEISLAK
jgi:hypothetical protein